MQCLYSGISLTQTADMTRDKLFTIRMTEEERERAERVAARYGLNVAGVVRMLLKREDDRTTQFPVEQPVPPREFLSNPATWSQRDAPTKPRAARKTKKPQK